MNANIKILIPFFLLVVLGGYIVFLLSPELAKASHYENLHHFFVQHLIAIGFGTGMLMVMKRLDIAWFDRLGALVLIIAIILFAFMMFSPEVRASRVVLRIGTFSMQPTLYFAVGVIWLIDFSGRVDSGSMKWMVRFIGLLTIATWILMLFVDPAMMILLGMVLLGMIVYMNGFSKTFFQFLGGILGIFSVLILNSPYRIERLKNWWEMIVGEKSYAVPSGIDLLVSKMHEGIFTYNEWGGIVLLVTTGLFVWLITILWRYESLFAKGIVMVLGVDILFQVINFFGLSLLKPPVLFIVEYGTSITLVSFLIILMVMIRQREAR